MPVTKKTGAERGQHRSCCFGVLAQRSRIRINDTTIAGSYKFNTLIGFSVGFDLAGSAPSASVLVRGGGNDASIDVPIRSNVARFGLGRVRVLAPFEGENAPAGAFFVNDVLASQPN